MRKTRAGQVKVRAISGTHVVFLAFDMKKADAAGLLGFAIHRDDVTEGESEWLRGNKSFPSTRPADASAELSSRDHPFQAFQWADYAAKPGHSYRYRVVPMFGRPDALVEGPSTTVTIETEPLDGAVHSVFWNRGAIASQAFTKRFAGQTLDEAGAPAYAWLTRDLLPGLLAFVQRAADQRFGIRAAIYEMRWRPVLDAFRAAHARGADVKIVYHASDDDTGADNEAEIAAAHIKGLCIPRRNAKLMHNKFLVLTKNGQPVAVWTGSTNLSRNALHGQLNVGHVVDDGAVASAYLDYWAQLANDPVASDMKDWSETANPLPPPSLDAITPVFSPRRGRAVFDWWIDIAGTPNKPLFMTFPFGIVADFRPVFDHDDGVLRFALLDKYVNGGNAASRAAAIAEIERIRRHPNVGMALGHRILVDSVDGWLKEKAGIGTNVNWVHTKFLLLDPLGNTPITITGSANWSLASVDTNDENMIVVRGDRRVADIYFGEFMRLFAHHRFRESVQRWVTAHGPNSFDAWKPQDLAETTAAWLPPHFASGSEHAIKRRYFADS